MRRGPLKFSTAVSHIFNYNQGFFSSHPTHKHFSQLSIHQSSYIKIHFLQHLLREITCMKNLVIYRDFFFQLKYLFYLLFLSQQSFHIVNICCSKEKCLVTHQFMSYLLLQNLSGWVCSCPFTVQFTWRQKQDNLFQMNYFLLADTFQLTKVIFK